MKGSLSFTGAALFLSAGMSQLYAQYDKIAGLGSDSAKTPNGGPASSPPVLNEHYDAPDMRPTGMLNDHLPKWLQFGLEERFRFESYSGSGFKPHNSDCYLLNPPPFGVITTPASWL